MNVLLVVLDSVRAANTSVHDHRRDTTPELARLAAQATNYEQARAPSNWTVPSHASMFTGLHLENHGLDDRRLRLEEGHSVFEALRDDGFETAVFSDNPFLTTADVGLAAGFDRVEGSSDENLFPRALDPHEYEGRRLQFLVDAASSGAPVRSLLNGAVTKLAWDRPTLLPGRLLRSVSAGSTPGAAYTDVLFEWVDEIDGNWAACINYMDAHHPLQPDAENVRWGGRWLERIRDEVTFPWGFYEGTAEWWQCEVLEYLYDAAVYQVDREVGRIVDGLKERDQYDETFLVVVGDHGEAFGERSRIRDGLGLAGHNVGAHEVHLHVPLVAKRPGQTDGETVEEVATLTNYPDAVDSARAGRSDRAFVPEGPVVASVHSELGERVETLADTPAERRRLTGDVFVVYEDDRDRVRKMVNWRDRHRTIEVHDARTAIPVATDNRNRVRSEFSSLEDFGIVDARDRGPDSATHQRLRELGYVE